MNYLQAVTKLAGNLEEGQRVAVGSLMRARAIDKIYPDRLDTRLNIFLFDGEPLDFWEILAPVFDGDVEFRTPIFAFGDDTLSKAQLVASPFLGEFSVSQLNGGLFGGGYLPSGWASISFDFAEYYRYHEKQIKSFGFYSIVLALADCGVLTVLDVNEKWPVMADDLLRMISSDNDRAAILGEFDRDVAIAVQKVTGAAVDTLTVLQPNNLVAALFSNFGLPIFAVVVGAAIFYGVKSAAETKVIQAAENIT